MGVDLLDEHASGVGVDSGGGIDQHSFLDASQLYEQFTHRVVFAGFFGLFGLFGFAAHELGDLQGQDASELWMRMFARVASDGSAVLATGCVIS